MKKPNIIYINSHDTGRYIQPYGHAIPTPNLQALAEQGVLFRQCFTINPTCSPSRSALLTGTYPHENGMLGLAHRGFGLSDYGQHLLHALKGAGYDTVFAGHQHICASGDEVGDCQTIGFDRFLGGFKNDEGLHNAVEFLRSKPQEPFYLEIGFTETHHPFPPITEAEDERYTRPPAPLPDTPETRKAMAGFKAAARTLDHKMGMVFDAVTENGLGQNTLIICTTDHGIPFPGMKCNLNDHGTGVFLIIRGPGFTGGQVIDAMVSHLDIFPTVCQVTGCQPPDRLRGKSLIPLVNGEEEELHDLVFDPNEASNLVGNPEYSEVLAEMRDRLSVWQNETRDPLLNGALAPPKGAKACRCDAKNNRDGLVQWNGNTWKEAD